jgi:XTP/dITP diphosphohydrolase
LLGTTATRTRTDLLLATTNPGKIQEFRALLPESIAIRSLIEAGCTQPEETGVTFAENAAMKAISASLEAGAPAIADDSGLEVDALDGRPGVYSARFGGEPSDSDRNIEKLLALLSGFSPERCRARFQAVVALAIDGAVVAYGRGTCEGTIVENRRGSNGFGYDPIFELPDGRTMAELAPAEKNAVSHRARAYRAILPELMLWLKVES